LTQRLISNREKIVLKISKYPGLRFHELKKETKLANGTLQHHLSSLEKDLSISVQYSEKVPRYFDTELDEISCDIIHRLRQNTTSRIIKSLIRNGCMTFSQIVSESKKSAGTVSVYKNLLLKDKIIIGDTDECKQCPEKVNKIKYRLIDPEKVRLLVEEYGKSSLRKSSDNLADVFLSL